MHWLKHDLNDVQTPPTQRTAGKCWRANGADPLSCPTLPNRRLIRDEQRGGVWVDLRRAEWYANLAPSM